MSLLPSGEAKTQQNLELPQDGSGGSCAVAVFNFGDILYPNARESIQDAARRWSAEYVEVKEDSGDPTLSPPAQKLRMFDVVPTERIFLVDADVLIRSDTPSPFQICPHERLGLVENAQPHLWHLDIVLNQEESEWAEVNRALNQSVRKRNYYNSGVVLASRRIHQDVFRRALQLYKEINPLLHLNWQDQTFINYAIQELGSDVYRFEKDWNCVHPYTVARQLEWMETYVYHFAGFEDRDPAMSRVDWHAPTSQRRAQTARATFPGFADWVIWKEIGEKSESGSIQKDPFWDAVALYLRERCSRSDRVLAQVAFRPYFPEAKTEYVLSISDDTRMDWAIVHKGDLKRLGRKAIRYVMQNLQPVFGNEVFVVFALNRQIPELSRRSHHYKQLLRELNIPRSLLRRCWHFLRRMLPGRGAN